MEHLIVKYINNELTRDEWKELKAWLDRGSSNRTEFNRLLSYTSNVNPDVKVLEEITWQELKARNGKQEQSLATQQRRSHWFNYYKVAAILLITSTISLVAYQLMFKADTDKVILVSQMVERSAPMGSKLTTRLSDGSIVTLNSGSTITFPEPFTGNSREVTLTGEAFFEVEHDPEKPFFVKMNGDEVRVLGTSFNIRSYPEDNVVSVSVATGRVSYTIPSGEEVILTPDQMVTYVPTEGRLLKDQVDRLEAFGWKDRILYFKRSSFAEVAKEISRWYGVEINPDDNFSEMGTYSAEFENPTLSEVLNSVSFVYRFSFKIEGNNVTIVKQ